ncbi:MULTISPECIES: hypothetical protein [unclassified Rhizobium]|uniref:hypothetical protein n=1 Tax=unclassified Rhizobium TaxID=2613769 RepID=UPI000CF245C9|nr:MULTISPECIES: hypothetical protein [Rhizobium]UWU20574.1 DUF3324 domain-containing protein [Rhizobium tropici]
MELGQIFSIGASVLALAMSATTLWLTLLRKGEIKMTKPTVIFFGPDGGTGEEKGISKVFLRTLLFSSAHRGHVVENAYARLRRGETQQNFSIWVYGEDRLARGSGLYVGAEGVATNHHFLTPSDVRNFDFAAGDYTLEIFAKIVGEKRVRRLTEINLTITQAEAEQLRQPGNGIYFDWGPDAGRYQSHVDSRPKKPVNPPLLLQALHDGAREIPERSPADR